ncbi:alpha/beta hydrolase family protein [Pseudomonas sp. NFXW11]|uniref:alpha/beta hydrolase family protein n=1 Tax=Pseudomonas sp. NFXW11 TaxID=2819531 RepID=UPI003CF143D2
MPLVHRSALPALCLSLILPWTFSAQAADPAAETKTPEEQPAPRQPLPERSQEDAAALERQLPAQEQQQLQAGGENFLALWKPANTAAPKGVVIILPGAGESADWPQVVAPLRNKLPDTDWGSLSLSLPDMLSEAARARVVEAAPVPQDASNTAKDASAEAKPIEQAAGGEAEVADRVVAESTEEQVKADAERIFSRIDAALAFAEQQNARSIVLLGHGTGAYWAARYVDEKQPSQVQKLVMVAAQAPANGKPQLAELTPTLKLATADIYYVDKAAAQKAALERLQASKRQKHSNFSQIALKALPGNHAAEQEQLFRRVRGWLNPQNSDS